MTDSTRAAPASSSSARRWSRWRMVIVAAAAIAAIVPTPPDWVERLYSRGAYPLLQRVLTSASNLVPFPLLDVSGIGLALAGVIWWRGRLRKTPPGGRLRAVRTLLADTATCGAAAYLLFLATWGLNYRRAPLEATLAFEPTAVSVARLEQLAHEAVDRVNQLHRPAHAAPWPGLTEIPSALAPAFARAQHLLPTAHVSVVGRPKRSALGWYFRRAAIDGMTNPFFLEVLVNDVILPYERPFLVAHEWAHLAGFADESEASFLGWVTCLVGDDQAAYSGWLALLPRLLRALPAEPRVAVGQRIAPGPRADLEQIRRRLSRSSPVIRQGADRVYDRFLRANRVAEGIASYGGVVELVLGTPLATKLRRATMTGERPPGTLAPPGR